MDKNTRDNITSTLEQLSRIFTTRDIMVKENQLVWADSESQARILLKEHLHFDVIPIKQSEDFLYFLHRDANHQSAIHLKNLISDSTPILELPNYFLKNDFYFVLSGKRIEGYIHFSDLNSQLVKIPYFVLLEAVESRIVEKIGKQIDEKDLTIVLPERAQSIINKLNRLAKENTDLGFINLMFFSDMLRFANYCQIINLQDKEIKWVIDIRNRVDHADRPLIVTKRDAIKLARTRELCMEMLDQLSR